MSTSRWEQEILRRTDLVHVELAIEGVRTEIWYPPQGTAPGGTVIIPNVVLCERCAFCRQLIPYRDMYCCEECYRIVRKTRR
jgi:hypothetical protein